MRRILLLICLWFMVSPITANEDPNKGFENNTNNSINESIGPYEINGSLVDLFKQYNIGDIYIDNSAVGPTGEQIRFLSIGDSGKPMNVLPIKPLAIGLSHYSRSG